MSRARRARRAEAPPRLFADTSPRRVDEALGELTVLTSDEDLVRWSRRRIVEVLTRETQVSPDLAERISRDIEETLTRAELTTVTTALLRELVGAELVARGLASEWLRQARLGMSAYDVSALLKGESGEGGRTSGASPEATSRRLGERIKRDYALAGVLSEPVAEAHRQGTLHVHDLELIDRPAGLSLGLGGLARLLAEGDGGPVAAEPGVEDFVGHLVRLAGFLGAYLGGPLGVDGLNLILAPLVAGRSDTELARIAALVLSRLAEAGSLRAVLYWDLPAPLAAIDVGGPAGKGRGTYGAHLRDARRLAAALIDRVARGDPGAPPGPAALRLTLVAGPELFHSSGHLAFLERAAAAARTGSLRVRFCRRTDPARAAATGRPPSPRPVGEAALVQEAVLASVSVSLPRIAFLEGKDEDAIGARLCSVLDLAARAHMDKRVFIEDLLARGAGGPLGPLADRSRGEALVEVEEAVCPVLLCGLNELAEVVTGEGLHASDEAMSFARRVLVRSARHIERLARRHKLRLVLGGEPAEPPAARFARLDLRHHSLRVGHHLKGDLARGQVRYTPGVALDLDAPIALRHRLELEGRLQEIAPWGAYSLVPASAFERGAAFLLEVHRGSSCREIGAVRAEGPSPATGRGTR